MHIVHLANFYGPTSGGLRTMVRALSAGYRAAGHRCTVIVPGSTDSWSGDTDGGLVTLASPLLPGFGGYRMITRPRRVAALLERLAPDRLEVSDRTSLRRFGRWARARGVPSVFFAHERLDGVLRTHGLPAAPARHVADLHNRGTAAAFDTVVATTRFAATEFHRIGTDDLRIVPLGVTTTPAVTTSPRRRGTELLLCSRLSTEKRPELALGVLRELRRRGHEVHLVVAGTGPLAARLQRESTDLPVLFHGHVADRQRLARIQASADIALAPGPVETFGLAALECLAAGTAVVADGRAGVPEVIGTDPAAGRAAPGTVHGFADAVEDLLAVPVELRRNAALARAAELPWSATVQRMLDLHLGAVR
ncbi:glycosyltransferase [Nakamurella sp. YIM 132087]|uniref:Glycosyltransferase n=1 Tax=Nakamurella alba TaxID=2665158 RepID=A0A7K1FPQ9_9ACTN|nr:glycosyltransferase [Nakamurella alba]MTD16117.1 glycosyltransferase [Nakamurella alba]